MKVEGCCIMLHKSPRQLGVLFANHVSRNWARKQTSFNLKSKHLSFHGLFLSAFEYENPSIGHSAVTTRQVTFRAGVGPKGGSPTLRLDRLDGLGPKEPTPSLPQRAKWLRRAWGGQTCERWSWVVSYWSRCSTPQDQA